MIKRFKIILTAFILISCLFFTVVPSAVAKYNPLCPTTDPNTKKCTSGACQGSAADSPLCKQAQTQGTNNPVAGSGGVINKAANIIALVTGIGAIIMILIGGFFYVTSAGNTESAGKAKAQILSAFIGLVVVALAWALVRLITDRVIK